MNRSGPRYPVRTVRAALLAGPLVALGALLGHLPVGAQPAAQLPAPKAPLAGPIRVALGDWPWWRGPTGDGVAEGKGEFPATWSDSENVLWKVPVPGRGHGSPTVVGEHVYLATGDLARQVQSVVCHDRKTGKQVWEAVVHEGGVESKGNGKSSPASATVACDGDRLFVNFLNKGAVVTTALDRAGKRLWQAKLTDFVMHQGFGSSPIPYRGLVLVSADHKGAGMVGGLDRATGKVVWRRERPKLPNYTSPVVLNVGGRDMVVFTGCKLVTALDPLTGKELWEVPGSTEECVTSTVTDGTHVFTSGGYPRNHVAAVRADTGKAAWENGTRVYVPSMVAKEGHLYAVQDAGMLVCWKSSTGQEVWKGRLGGTFSASLVLAGDRILATNEAGQTFVARASPEKFELLGKNQLGQEALATPTVCGGRIYHRVASTEKGVRREWLVCLGKE